MILGMSIGTFTFLHVVITLVAIGSGLIIVGGMFASRVLPVTTALFLHNGIDQHNGVPLPHSRFYAGIGRRCLGLCDPTGRAVCFIQRAPSRRMALDLCDHAIASLFVLVAQSFMKVAALNALAPTQAEPPFAITQSVVLMIFVLTGLIALVKF
jgi:hypothetical protein